MGAQLSNYGLKYDDIRNEADDDVAAALEATPPPPPPNRPADPPRATTTTPRNLSQRLSRTDLSDRNKRLKRAVDLSLKHT